MQLCAGSPLCHPTVHAACPSAVGLAGHGQQEQGCTCRLGTFARAPGTPCRPSHTTTGACRGRGSKHKQKALQSSYTHDVWVCRAGTSEAESTLDSALLLLRPGPLQGSRMPICSSTGNAACHAVVEAAGNAADAGGITTTWDIPAAWPHGQLSTMKHFVGAVTAPLGGNDAVHHSTLSCLGRWQDTTSDNCAQSRQPAAASFSCHLGPGLITHSM